MVTRVDATGSGATSADFARKTFLIIAGQPKAGTTSLFDWLAQHPEICASNMKETRFFLDETYPLPRAHGYDGSNLARYADFFDHSDRKVLMEATPDYMFCDTFLDVAQLLPDARVVVLLRDPVERMVSAYRYFRQRGLLRRVPDFESYVRQQASQGVEPDTPAEFRALDHCRPDYLRRLEAAFGERLFVADFSRLRDAPSAVLADLSAFLGIEVMDMAAVDLNRSNKSLEARNEMLSGAYYGLRKKLDYAVHGYPRVRRVLRPFGSALRRAVAREPRNTEVPVPDPVKRIIYAHALGTGGS